MADCNSVTPWGVGQERCEGLAGHPGPHFSVKARWGNPEPIEDVPERETRQKAVRDQARKEIPALRKQAEQGIAKLQQRFGKTEPEREDGSEDYWKYVPERVVQTVPVVPKFKWDEALARAEAAEAKLISTEAEREEANERLTHVEALLSAAVSMGEAQKVLTAAAKTQAGQLREALRTISEHNVDTDDGHPGDDALSMQAIARTALQQ